MYFALRNKCIILISTIFLFIYSLFVQSICLTSHVEFISYNLMIGLFFRHDRVNSGKINEMQFQSCNCNHERIHRFSGTIIKLHLRKTIFSKSSHPEVFLGKDVPKICSKFTRKHPCRSVISIKLLCNLIEITLRHGCSAWVFSCKFTAYFQNTFS